MSDIWSRAFNNGYANVIHDHVYDSNYQEVTFPNGDIRIGTLFPNGTGHWTGIATFIEANGFNIPGFGSRFGFLDKQEEGSSWTENWFFNNGSTTYLPEARIYKNVVNKVNCHCIYGIFDILVFI